MSGRLRAVPVGAALFFALLVATLAVSVLVVRARTPDLALEVRSIVPRTLVLAPGEDPEPAEITFFVRKTDPGAEVTIIDPSDELVRRLAGPLRLEANRTVTYRWDWRTSEGRLVRPGRYRLRVELPEEGRDMIWPRRLIVVPPGGEGAP